MIFSVLDRLCACLLQLIVPKVGRRQGTDSAQVNGLGPAAVYSKEGPAVDDDQEILVTSYFGKGPRLAEL